MPESVSSDLSCAGSRGDEDILMEDILSATGMVGRACE
jgi:hypothetical protein